MNNLPEPFTLKEPNIWPFKCKQYKTHTTRVWRGRGPAAACLPSAVEEGHPRGAAPGHGRGMEPEGRGAPAVGAPLEAVIAASDRSGKRETNS